MSEITKAEATPLAMASLGIYGGDGKVIESQERQGATEMVKAIHTLPVKGSDDPDVIRLGIEWGEVYEADQIFREATLPLGWVRHGTGHDMWTDILDERGVVRAKVFYKAAFYDRRALIRVATTTEHDDDM